MNTKSDASDAGARYMNDEEIQSYINEAFSEEVIRRYEEQLLSVMKTRYEKYPSDKNDKEWLDFTNYVCRRRYQRVSND